MINIDNQHNTDRLKILTKRDLMFISEQKLQELRNKRYIIEGYQPKQQNQPTQHHNQLSNNIQTLAALTKLVGQTLTLTSKPSGGTPNYAVEFLKGTTRLSYQTGITPAMALAGVTYTYPPSPGTLTTSDSATYNIIVTDTCTGNTSTYSSDVTVYPLLSVPVITVTGISGTCPNISSQVNNTITMSTSPSGGYGTYTYQWYLGANPISGATSSSYSFTGVATSAGSYTVRVSDATSGQNNISSPICTLTISCTPLGFGGFNMA